LSAESTRYAYGAVIDDDHHPPIRSWPSVLLPAIATERERFISELAWRRRMDFVGRHHRVDVASVYVRTAIIGAYHVFWRRQPRFLPEV
jgi:hypothetical protein